MCVSVYIPSHAHRHDPSPVCMNVYGYYVGECAYVCICGMCMHVPVYVPVAGLCILETRNFLSVKRESCASSIDLNT